MKLPDIDKARAAEWILAALLLVVCWFGGDHHGRRVAFAEAESKTDTVTKVITLWKEAPQPAKTALLGYVPVPAYKFLTDTIERVKTAEIVLHDTTVVYLPREQKYYEENDGRLRLWVSGYDPRLDRWELDERQTTITQTVVPRRRWGIGVTAGYGLALTEPKVALSPFVGVGITYAFLQF